MESVDRIMVRAAGAAMAHASPHLFPRAPAPREEKEEEDFPFQEHYTAARDAFLGLIPLVQRAVYLSLVGSLLLVTSIATYAVFYWIMLPAPYPTEPLYFDYTCKDTAFCEVSSLMDKVPANGSLTPPQSCSPCASVDIAAKHTHWEAFHPDVVPPPISDTRVLKAGQAYFLEVSLSLPESEVNRKVGMFGVQVELKTRNGTTLASSSRAARIPHESNWIGIIRKSLCLAPLLVGAMTETRTVVIPSFRHFVESEIDPLQHIVVKLLPRGTSWTMENTPVEVVSAQLKGGKELNRFQFALKEWFFTCAVIGTLIAFICQAAIWSVLHVWFQWQRRRAREEAIRRRNEQGFVDAVADFDFLDEDDEDQWDEMPPLSDNQEAPGAETLDLSREMPPAPPEGFEFVNDEDDDQWHDISSDHQEGQDTEARGVSRESHPVATSTHVDEQQTRSNDSRGASLPQTAAPDSPATRRKEEELLAERVLRGETRRYEIFTDHDDPDISSYDYADVGLS